MSTRVASWLAWSLCAFVLLLLKRIISERFSDTHHERSDVASFQVERMAFMAMTTTTMPHPTTDHVVGQWMNRRQDMILPIPLIALIATVATTHYSLRPLRTHSRLSAMWPAKL